MSATVWKISIIFNILVTSGEDRNSIQDQELNIENPGVSISYSKHIRADGNDASKSKVFYELLSVSKLQRI